VKYLGKGEVLNILCFVFLTFLVGSSNIGQYNMFEQRHLLRSGLTYGLTYHTPHQDHLIRGIESTKRFA